MCIRDRIDTGVQRLAVLDPILEHDGLDLVDKNAPHPYEIDLRSDSSHGTTVATLAAVSYTHLSLEYMFFRSIRYVPRDIYFVR